MFSGYDWFIEPIPTKEDPSHRQVGGDHYKKLKIQPSEYIFANSLGWAEGNAIAYITRWKDKGGIQDLEKAIHTLQLLIEENKNE